MIRLDIFKSCSSLIDKVDLNIESLSFCIDTREYVHPSFFVAIPGAKVNPLDRVDDILKLKCPLVIYENNEANKQKVKALQEAYPDTTFLSVIDSIVFLQELSHVHIERWKKKSTKNIVFAISGSNGKTTHKEMLSSIMKEVLPGKIIATRKNNNNHLGVPLTLLEVNDSTEFVILELGSNHPGEIKVLCDIAVPNAGMTTNIGATHLEFFGDEEKVFLEEAYLFHAVNSLTDGKGFFLVNKDDRFLTNLPQTVGSVAYGTDPSSEAKISFLENGAVINWKNLEITAHNEHITGRHNKLNLVTCLFIASHFYPEFKKEFSEAAKNFRPTKNRSEWIVFEGRSIFLDAYNANPSSMKAALQGFKEDLSEKGFNIAESCLVLGDMNELGEAAPAYHKELGEYVGKLGFSNVVFIGRYAEFYRQGFPLGECHISGQEFKAKYRNECLRKFPIHFIKGSRSLQLESLLDIT